MKFALTIVATASAVEFGPYPGYTGPLKVKGAVDAYYTGDTVNVNYNMQGIENACKTTPVGVANACGIHIQAGTTCEDAAAVGGHYFDATSLTADPWAPMSYGRIRRDWKGETSVYGSFDVKIGKEQNIFGRAVVVHDKAGARVACALLPATLFTPHHEMRFGAYQAEELPDKVATHEPESALDVHTGLQDEDLTSTADCTPDWPADSNCPAGCRCGTFAGIHQCWEFRPDQKWGKCTKEAEELTV